MKDLTFQNTTLTLMNIDGELWVAGIDVGRALGYHNPGKKIHELYSRHVDEFTYTMTRLIGRRDLDPQTGDAGQMRKVRVFSMRGAHLLAMLARTEKAKAFRRWVLDILDSLHGGGEYVMEQYRLAQAEYQQGQEVASSCGKGLNQWKTHKQALKQRVTYWEERQQLSLELAVDPEKDTRH